jgi:hypothetical protein
MLPSAITGEDQPVQKDVGRIRTLKGDQREIQQVNDSEVHSDQRTQMIQNIAYVLTVTTLRHVQTGFQIARRPNLSS